MVTGTRSLLARVALAGPLTLTLLALGCVRPPLSAGCPDLQEGDLVISELRGAQSGTDTLGQWIELYNASQSAADLAGLQVVLRPLSGSASTLTVRGSLDVASDDYVVLGVDRVCSSSECTERLPPGADYGFGMDYTRDLPAAGAIVEVWSCGQLLDSALYRALPDEGTLSLSGDAPPDAALNDVASDDAGDPLLPWCADAFMPPAGGGPVVDVGIPGTPGEMNRVCP